MLPCGLDDGMKVKSHIAFHSDISDLLLESAQGVEAHHRLDMIERIGGLAIKEHLDLVFFAWVAEADPHDESVKLRFGKGISALVIDGVLGGDHEKRRGEGVRCAVDRHLSFVHGLKKSGLCTRRGAVDLVGKQEVMEDRALVEMKGAVFGIEDRGAEDIGRKEIGGKLNAGKVEMEGLGEGFGQCGFADPGDIFEQDVSSAEDAKDGQLDAFALGEDDTADRGEDITQGRLGVCRGGLCVRWLGHL